MDDTKIREQYGTLSSTVGIVCNICLFCLKFLIGTMANSVSIISDAFNNLSDSTSSVVSLVGYKMAAKPADKDHPFGHGRVEYLVTLIIASIIVFVGFEFFMSSVDKIRNPESVTFSIFALISLLVSIGIKFWLFAFNTKLGKSIQSPGMLATAKDSLADVVATSATILSLLFGLFSDFSIDGWAGIVVSCFILYSGYGIIRDTVDTLLGKGADLEMVRTITDLILSGEDILGVHDLIVHSYGPGKMFASVHVEVRADVDFVSIHEQIDAIERKILHELGIMIVIHMDPVDMRNPMLLVLVDFITATLFKLDARLESHDYRVVYRNDCPVLVFDVVVPYEVKLTNQEIKAVIDEKLKQSHPEYLSEVTFDRGFM